MNGKNGITKKMDASETMDSMTYDINYETPTRNGLQRIELQKYGRQSVASLNGKVSVPKSERLATFCNGDANMDAEDNQEANHSVDNNNQKNSHANGFDNNNDHKKYE